MDLGLGGTVPPPRVCGVRGGPASPEGWGWGGVAVCFFFLLLQFIQTLSHTASGTWPEVVGAGSQGNQTPLLSLGLS